MNNTRRKQLKELINHLDDIKSRLEMIESDEEMAFDNMTEGLKMTDIGMESEEAIDTMNIALESLDDIIDTLDVII